MRSYIALPAFLAVPIAALPQLAPAPTYIQAPPQQIQYRPTIQVAPYNQPLPTVTVVSYAQPAYAQPAYAPGPTFVTVAGRPRGYRPQVYAPAYADPGARVASDLHGVGNGIGSIVDGTLGLLTGRPNGGIVNGWANIFGSGLNILPDLIGLPKKRNTVTEGAKKDE